MKTLLMFGSVTALALSTLAVELTSSNVLGIQQVKQNKNEVVVPVTFAGVGTQGGATTLAETLYLDNLSMADTVMVMQNDADEYYKNWIWLPGFMNELYWTSRYDGQTVEVKPSQQALFRGVGVKLNLAQSSTRVYTMGEYCDNPISITLEGRATSYLANPSSSKLLDFDEIFSGEKYSFSGNDSITYFDGNREITYFYKPNGSGKYWARPKIEYYVEDGELKTDTSAYDWEKQKMQPGQGFRFHRGGRSALMVTF